jgi:hypothetical protein
MKRLAFCLAALAASFTGLAAPAASDAPPSWYQCTHGNVGPINGHFWVWVRHTNYWGSHYEYWAHYTQGSDGRYYFQHYSWGCF